MRAGPNRMFLQQHASPGDLDELWSFLANLRQRQIGEARCPPGGKGSERGVVICVEDDETISGEIGVLYVLAVAKHPRLRRSSWASGSERPHRHPSPDRDCPRNREQPTSPYLHSIGRLGG